MSEKEKEVIRLALKWYISNGFEGREELWQAISLLYDDLSTPEENPVSEMKYTIEYLKEVNFCEKEWEKKWADEKKCLDHTTSRFLWCWPCRIREAFGIHAAKAGYS